MLKYGTDKPDLRNPMQIADVTEAFRGSGFKVFAGAIEKGAVVRAIPAPAAVGRPRSFFDQMVAFAQSQGAPGLGWITLGDGEAKGPIAKFLDAERLRAAAGGSAAWRPAMPCSSSATSRHRRPSSPASSAPASARSWA